MTNTAKKGIGVFRKAPHRALRPCKHQQRTQQPGTQKGNRGKAFDFAHIPVTALLHILSYHSRYGNWHAGYRQRIQRVEQSIRRVKIAKTADANDPLQRNLKKIPNDLNNHRSAHQNQSAVQKILHFALLTKKHFLCCLSNRMARQFYVLQSMRHPDEWSNPEAFVLDGLNVPHGF